MNKLSNKKMVLLLVAMSGTALAWTPHDSTNDWNVASGNASVAANFDPATAPGADTLVRISNGGEMTINSDLSWGALWIGGTGDGTVRHESGTLTVNNPASYPSMDHIFSGADTPITVREFSMTVRTESASTSRALSSFCSAPLMRQTV